MNNGAMRFQWKFGKTLFCRSRRSMTSTPMGGTGKRTIYHPDSEQIFGISGNGGKFFAKSCLQSAAFPFPRFANAFELRFPVVVVISEFFSSSLSLLLYVG
ncbi:hypothetical protein TNIN_499921 [Trichonephila inaurata madagascariensis]|uniref:Uncharacterized protein n=1 Tax=Trichonephila inaurata madagascariensis TaxID=2747483 RepID=A0A8X7CRY6_9ARAC|nr:hypothetical protein TNIN_499921 [Trichonephila inaurata madagascariensis]